jgi:hypothetical protein
MTRRLVASESLSVARLAAALAREAPDRTVRDVAAAAAASRTLAPDDLAALLRPFFAHVVALPRGRVGVVFRRHSATLGTRAPFVLR